MSPELSVDRTSELADVVAELARMLAAEFDVVDLLDRVAGHCVSLLHAHEAGVVLTDHTGTLTVVAATSEQARFLELFQLQRQSGPCLESVRRGEPVDAPDLAARAASWPDFAAYAQREGYRSVHATPLNTPTATIGALNIFSKQVLRLEPTDLKIAQALAELGTVAVLHRQAVTRAEEVAGQLQKALSSRVIIEQAKGKLSEQGNIDTGEAFAVLRGFARRHQRQLSATARAVVEGHLSLDDMK
jgi:transcriptional regulator with GAF, ATPase, and Fis domain